MASTVHRGYITFSGTVTNMPYIYSGVTYNDGTCTMQYFSIDESDGSLRIPPTSAIITGVTGTVTGGIRQSANLDESGIRRTSFGVALSSGNYYASFQSTEYKYPDKNSSFGNMNNMNGTFSASASHTQMAGMINKFITTGSGEWNTGFSLFSDSQAMDIQNRTWSWTLRIDYTWVTYSQDRPQVYVTPVIAYDDNPVTYTVQDYGKQNMSNGSAAMTQYNEYQSYYADNPSVIISSGSLADLNPTVTTDTTNRIWTYTINPPGDLRLCYQFGSQLIDTVDSRQNSSMSWSQPVRRAARVSTPLRLELTSQPMGSKCSIKWYSSSVTGWTTDDLYYRITLAPQNENPHYIYVQHVNGETYQTYDIPNIGKYFSAPHQSCTITVQATLTTEHQYSSAESNSVSYTWLPHSIVRYYDTDDHRFSKCTMRGWKGVGSLNADMIVRYMKQNYYSSVDFSDRPLVSQADLTTAGWTTTYSRDTLCPQILYSTVAKRLQVMTPILSDGSVINSTALNARMAKLEKPRSPVAKDLAINTEYTVVDWVDDVTQANYQELYDLEEQRIDLLQTLQQIYYIDAPAVETNARAQAETDGLSSEEIEEAVESALQDYYDSLTTVFEEMQTLDRVGVVSGWAVLNPFVWTGSAWRQCTF